MPSTMHDVMANLVITKNLNPNPNPNPKNPNHSLP